MNLKGFMCFRNARVMIGFGAIIALLSLSSEALSASTELEFNRRATATAQLLAGITPNPPEPAFFKFIELDPWKEHQKWMSTQWALVRARLNIVENWRDHEIKIGGAQKKTMIYPFSGPDFINAYVFFPDHSRYVFFSLERPGTLPDLESVTTVQFGRLLGDVRSAFREIFERNYFITSYHEQAVDDAVGARCSAGDGDDDGAHESTNCAH